MQTRRERAGSVDGINLFFGALIGANLGTLDGMGPRDYAILIALLAGTVTALRLFSLTDRRGPALAGLSLWLALLAVAYFVPALHPPGLAAADLDRLAITVAIWTASVLAFELSPVRGESEAEIRPETAPVSR